MRLRSCGSVLYQGRRHSQRCQLVDIGVLQLPRLVFRLSQSPGDEFVSNLIAPKIPVILFRVFAHFGGVTRYGSASLGRAQLVPGGGGRAGPYIQESLGDCLATGVPSHFRRKKSLRNPRLQIVFQISSTKVACTKLAWHSSRKRKKILV